MLKYIIAFTFSLLFFSSCFSPQKEKVDTIIHHAVIYSVDSTFTIYEAMCVRDGKIIDIGSNEIILKNYGIYCIYLDT